MLQTAPSRRGWRLYAAAAGLVLVALATPPLARAQDANPWDRFVGAEAPGYPDPDALVGVFTDLLAAGDIDGTLAMLGLTPEARTSDNFDEDFAMVASFAQAEKVALRDLDADRKILLLGRDVWPFPFPIVHTGGSWMFDTVAGLDEIINRRIGENEIQAIATERDYVSAQEVYWQTDWDEDGVVEYAQRLISTPETFDGLYWPSGDGVPASPAGAYIEEAALPGEDSDGYFGYRFRILKGQGSNIAGGAYDYVINGNMITLPSPPRLRLTSLRPIAASERVP